MASKITPELQADLQAHVGQPLPLQDDDGNVVYYVIDAETFKSFEYEQRLQVLLEEGDNSPDVPADEAHSRMRQSMQDITDKYA